MKNVRRQFCRLVCCYRLESFSVGTMVVPLVCRVLSWVSSVIMGPLPLSVVGVVSCVEGSVAAVVVGIVVAWVVGTVVMGVVAWFPPRQPVSMQSTRAVNKNNREYFFILFSSESIGFRGIIPTSTGFKQGKTAIKKF